MMKKSLMILKPTSIPLLAIKVSYLIFLWRIYFINVPLKAAPLAQARMKTHKTSLSGFATVRPGPPPKS